MYGYRCKAKQLSVFLFDLDLDLFLLLESKIWKKMFCFLNWGGGGYGSNVDSMSTKVSRQ